MKLVRGFVKICFGGVFYVGVGSFDNLVFSPKGIGKKLSKKNLDTFQEKNKKTQSYDIFFDIILPPGLRFSISGRANFFFDIL